MQQTELFCLIDGSFRDTEPGATLKCQNARLTVVLKCSKNDETPGLAGYKVMLTEVGSPASQSDSKRRTKAEVGAKSLKPDSFARTGSVKAKYAKVTAPEGTAVFDPIDPAIYRIQVSDPSGKIIKNTWTYTVQAHTCDTIQLSDDFLGAIANDLRSTLAIVPRNSWGKYRADYSKIARDCNYETIVVHHSGDGGDLDPVEIESKHVNKNKWDEVGYHYLISREGTIYEGTLLGWKGSHVASANTGKIGIIVLGDFNPQWWDLDHTPTSAQIDSLRTLSKSLKKAIPTIIKLGGHRDFKQTACPGDDLYKLIEGIRNDVGLAAP